MSSIGAACRAGDGGQLRAAMAELQGGEIRGGVPARARSRRPGPLRSCCAGVLAAILLAAWGSGYAQRSLPDAPSPQPELMQPELAARDAAPGAMPQQQTFPPQAKPLPGVSVPGLQPNYVPEPRPCRADSCSERAPKDYCCEQNFNVFGSYLNENAIHIYTPEELGKLAVRGVIDPFNLMTIVLTSAYSVATDSHSPYGPGINGTARLSGVSLTQDMTGAFFGTFLIPSLDHQDPHYHRMPNASLKRRIAHCLYQPFWTDSDTGQGMPNYSTLVGTVADEAVDITYVPYQQVGWGPSAERIASSWATAPIGNFVTEFVPDVARHVNINVVFVQRIIDRVALEEGGGAPSGAGVP